MKTEKILTSRWMEPVYVFGGMITLASIGWGLNKAQDFRNENLNPQVKEKLYDYNIDLLFDKGKLADTDGDGIISVAERFEAYGEMGLADQIQWEKVPGSEFEYNIKFPKPTLKGLENAVNTYARKKHFVAAY